MTEGTTDETMDEGTITMIDLLETMDEGTTITTEGTDTTITERLLVLIRKSSLHGQCRRFKLGMPF